MVTAAMKLKDACVLAIMNRAAMNIGYMYLSVLEFFLDLCPGVGFLHHKVILFLVFLGTSIQFSIGSLPTYTPTNSVGEFPFIHSLSSICYL